MENHTGPVTEGITYDIIIEEDKYTINKPRRVITRARIYQERRTNYAKRG